MTQITLSVPEISCAHCQNTIEGAVRELAGVSDAHVDIPGKTVTVDFDSPADRGQIESTIVEAGYDIAGAPTG